MLRSSFLFLLFGIFLFASYTTDNFDFDQGEFGFKKKTKSSSTPCATAFLSQTNPPGSEIIIVDVITGAVVSSFTVNPSGYSTDYVTLQTGRTYQWTTSISLPGEVLYCSCGDNLGMLQHGPAASKFTTSDDGSPYTACSF